MRVLSTTLSLALLCAASTTMNSQQHAPANTWHMKRVTFQQNTAIKAMPEWNLGSRPGRMVDALAMMVPVDWSFQAFLGGLKQSDCNFTTGRLGFFTTSPDKNTGLLVLPGTVALWSNDRSILQNAQTDNKQFAQNHLCHIEQPQPLATRIIQLSNALSKDVKITGPMQPIPGLTDNLPAMLAHANQALARQAAQQGQRPPHLEAEAGRIPTCGSEKDGTQTEGFLAVLQVVRTDYLPSGAILQSIDTPMQVISFAPVGKYASQAAMFNVMLDSVTIDPDYQGMCLQIAANKMQIQQITKQKLAQIYANMAADNANTTRKIAAIQQGAVDYSSQVHASVAANRSAAFEHSTQQFALSMNDQAIYKDPSTGQRVQMSNQYSHAWASTTGNTNEYILTDSPSFNPNGQVGSAAWKQMQPE